MEVTVWTVFVAASLTALATGLGALPFFVFPRMSRSWLGISNSIAAGFMLGASAALFWEGADIDVARTALGALVGVAFIEVTRWHHVRKHSDRGLPWDENCCVSRD